MLLWPRPSNTSCLYRYLYRMLDLVSASLQPRGSGASARGGGIGQVLGTTTAPADQPFDPSQLPSEDVESQYDAFELDAFVRNVLRVGGEGLQK